MTAKMSASKAERQGRIDALCKEMGAAPLIALIDYEKITVEQVNNVRRTFEEKGITYKVEKKYFDQSCSGRNREGRSRCIS